ncbi:MAG TPA: PQQ-dependent sugar dehydrogenase [Thermoflexales bacterium]|nr:PQQ-dependent sugar dehydrogenase [Thermoflexales bacterium]
MKMILAGVAVALSACAVVTPTSVAPAPAPTAALTQTPTPALPLTSTPTITKTSPATATPTPIPSAQSAPWRVETVIEGVNRPWSLNFAPDGRLFFTSRNTGVISAVDVARGGVTAFSGLPRVRVGGEAGLLGMALDPDFARTGWLYACYSYSAAGLPLNRLSRFSLRDRALIDETILIDAMPGAMFHNGCRVVIGPDGLLYATMGEASQRDLAQNPASLGGKTFRINTNGSIPPGNPFGNSPIWTLGHRNPQGLAFHPVTGALWSTEHGPEKRDELNILRPGMNYGWPACEGTAPVCGRIANYVPAVRQYEDNATIAISDLVFYTGNAFPAWRNQLFFVSLKTGRLYRLVLDGERVADQEVLIDNTYGRLRDVTVGPDGFIYFSTDAEDGKILRLRPR